MRQLIPMISSDTAQNGSRALPAASLWRTRYVSAERTGNIAGICSVASLYATTLAALSNGMASSPILRIDGGRKTPSENKRRSYGQMLDFAPELIVVFGPNFHRLYANRAALDYAGFTLEEWRRMTVKSFIQTTGRAGTIMPAESPPIRWSYGCARPTEVTGGFSLGSIQSATTRPGHSLVYVPYRHRRSQAAEERTATGERGAARGSR